MLTFGYSSLLTKWLCLYFVSRFPKESPKTERLEVGWDTENEDFIMRRPQRGEVGEEEVPNK